MSSKAQGLAYKAFLFDIFVTACEGGINYWASIHKYKWRDSGGGTDFETFEARAVDEHDGDTVVIDKEVIHRGLQRILNDAKLPSLYAEKLIERIENLEASNIDATDADTIVQIGLWGEVLYG